MRICATFVLLVGSVLGSVVYAASLKFPDLGLASSPEDVCSWVGEHQFTQARPIEPGAESYQRQFEDGHSELVSFLPGDSGLRKLQFDQRGVLELARMLRKKVYDQFGKPDKDQILEGGTLRLIYPYDYTEPARRVFLLQPHFVSMVLMTEAYVDQVNLAEEEVERAQKARAQAEKHELRRAWLVPLLWVAGIGLALAIFIGVAPRPVSAPVRKLLQSVFGVVFEVISEVALWVYHGTRVVLLYGLFGFSALTVGVGAAEWGSSWWWAAVWFAGTVMMFKAHDEEEIRTEVIAIVLFAIAILGVFVQAN